MAEYRVYFCVTQDFYEDVSAEDGNDAVREARIRLVDTLHNRYAASQDIAVVKIEQL